MTSSVAVIGLGDIGMVYDLTLPDSVLSHARAFFKHPEFKLIGGVDSKDSLRNIFTENYNAMAFSNVSELIKHCSPDIVVISTPTDTHLKIINELLQLHVPQLILCEKPLAYSAEESKDIIDLCNKYNTKLFVNFIRRTDTAAINVKSRISSGKIQMPFKSIIWYSKGLIHNGSHFMDLMTFWFGSVQSIKLISVGLNIGSNDAEPDFEVTFDNGSAIFCSAEDEKFAHYTIEIVASNGRLRYEQDGEIFWQKTAKHKSIENYRQLNSDIEIIKHNTSQYQYNVADHLYLALSDQAHELCSGVQAFETMTWLHKILDERKK